MEMVVVLVYKRARFYEPGSGRFISEDPARDGVNWFEYARNNPVSLSDLGGTNPFADNFTIAMVGAFFAYVGAILTIGFLYPDDKKYGAALKGAFAIIIAAMIESGQLLVDNKTLSKEMTSDEFHEKMNLKMKQGFVKGILGGIGTLVAMYLGARSGLLLAQIWEMDYIDNA